MATGRGVLGEGDPACQPIPPQGPRVGRVGLAPSALALYLPAARQKLDLERETIELVHTEPTEVAQLPSRVPRDAARYHFFLYKHTHEGDPLESVGEWPMGGQEQPWPGAGWPCSRGRPGLTSMSPAVFIYSMPGYRCSVRERMLYSSCKSRLLDSAEQDFLLDISRKVGAAPPAPPPRARESRCLVEWMGRQT